MVTSPSPKTKEGLWSLLLRRKLTCGWTADKFAHAHPLTAMEREVPLAQAVSSLLRGMAVGPDRLPIELIRVGGGCVHLLASDVKKMVDRGAIPHRWRCGEMVPVKKKASKPLTTVSRGCFCSLTLRKLTRESYVPLWLINSTSWLSSVCWKEGMP